MKKLIMAVVFVAVTLGNAAFAGEKDIDKRIRQTFEKEFTGATDVLWQSYDGYATVDFSFNNMRLIVYYNNEGERLALVRNIPFSSLPLMLQLEVKKNYRNYWITKIFELSNKEGTQYHLTLENADTVVRLRSSDANEWEFVRKDAKK